MGNSSMLTHQSPIKSQVRGGLVDSHSAELVLGELPASCGVPDLVNDDEVISACWRIRGPIESRFMSGLVDNLNAELVLGKLHSA